MRRSLQFTIVLAGGFLLGGGTLCAAVPALTSSASAAAVACTVEQVALRAADGALLNGILYRPAAHPRSAAFLLVHGFGANFYEAYFPSFAQATAKHGYVSLALNMRDHDTGPKVSDFADNEVDIAAGADYLRKLGHSKLVLLGQSIGTNRVLYYQAARRDPAVVATVLVAGPGNLFEWNVWQFGWEAAQATVDEALRLQKTGRGQQVMVVDLGPLGKALYTPRYLLSLRGPDARSDPYQNIQKVTNPVLIVQGKSDKLVQPDIADRLRRAATSSARVELIYLEGADHSFRGQEAVLSDRILAWLKEVAP